MRIEKVTVEELYNSKGFDDMMAEYSQLAIKKLPKPLFHKEDYLPLEALGVLTVWRASYAGVAVGFASCLISKIPHYGIGIAIGESLFVREEFRRFGVGVRLMAVIEGCAASSGALAVFMSCPIDSDLKKVFEHRNYSAETVTYVKSLCSHLA